MSMYSGHVSTVIFAGNQFHQPFSHTPEWLEDAIACSDIYKKDGEWYFGKLKMQAGYKIEFTKNQMFYEYLRGLDGGSAWTSIDLNR